MLLPAEQVQSVERYIRLACSLCREHYMFLRDDWHMTRNSAEQCGLRRLNLASFVTTWMEPEV